MRVFRFWILFYLACGLISCSKNKYSPDTYHSKEDQARILRQTLFYNTKLPPNASKKTRFDPEFKWYYDKAMHEYTLDYSFVDDLGVEYFFISRKARSLKPMREGIGGKLKLSSKGELAEYEEIFRTWKLPADTLAKRGAFLFDRMIKGKDLTLYYTKYQRDQFIEFPDQRFHFDKTERGWKDREIDSLNIRGEVRQ